MQVQLTFYIGLVAQQGQHSAPGFVIDGFVSPIFAEHGEDGFTATEGRGYWKGKGEPALIITTIVNPASPLNSGAEVIARRLAQALDQECVLLTRQPIQADFVYA